MKKIVLAAASVLALSLTSCTINKPAEAPRVITVSGSGTVSVSPDLVSVKFIVRSSGWNVSQTVERNAINTNNAIAAIKAAGLADDDIFTSDYKITQDNSQAYPGQYTVRNTISVIIRNPELTGKVIDAAVKQNVGANGVTDFEYMVSDRSTALRQARTLAIKDAQDAANLLAGASGCKVGNVLEISENYTSTSRNDGVMLAKAANSMAETTIEPGKLDITSNVTIKYTIE
ncbi:SIMPL domain-containing protein [Treponema sp. C6A8]|uniref:SIMPL domain-containing protein n=1 Tax=Treponema sp. C6A8 TaxID=1410609 RepID=UPI0004839790|nr:SIMPL domain-containing protein [Treponema sp. C6A8]